MAKRHPRLLKISLTTKKVISRILMTRMYAQCTTRRSQWGSLKRMKQLGKHRSAHRRLSNDNHHRTNSHMSNLCCENVPAATWRLATAGKKPNISSKQPKNHLSVRTVYCLWRTSHLSSCWKFQGSRSISVGSTRCLCPWQLFYIQFDF